MRYAWQYLHNEKKINKIANREDDDVLIILSETNE